MTPATSHYRLRLLLVIIMVVMLIILTGGYAVFRALSPTFRQASSAFQHTNCPFPLGKGLVQGQDVQCGFLTVPEDHSHPLGPTIRLAVAIFKSPDPHPAPDPVLVLGGGPGDPQLSDTGPLISMNNLATVTAGRDFILLDQRGEGYSQPSLNCQNDETMQVCHDHLVKDGINLNDYTTLQNAADVHDLVRVLGYHQVNLDGVSYGSRLALTIMRLYSTDLRSVVLNSVDPPQVNLITNLAHAAVRAFDVLFHGCATDPDCNAAYPHLEAVFYQLVARLNTTPITFQVPLQTGKSYKVYFTGDDFVLWLRDALYDTPYIAQLPSVIFQARQHNYTQLASIYSNLINSTMSWGLFHSVECGEDEAFTTRQALQASVQGLPLQAQTALLDMSMSLFSVCQFWGMKPVPTIQKEPVISSIPTLILQGEYDPVTPPSNGMLAAQTLKRSYFFLFPGVGHGVRSTLSTCPQDITQAFWVDPTEKPDASCISRMTEPFFI